MSDIPTASTSTASTSTESPASTSRIHPGPYHNKFRNVVQDIDLSLSSESEVSEVLYDSEESITTNEESSSDEADHTDGDNDETADDASWSSVASSAVYTPISSTVSSVASSVVSCEDKSSSDQSETESSVARERSSDEKSIADDDKHSKFKGTKLILIQQPRETESQIEVGIDLINVEDHSKRLKDLEQELDFIESTEWMYQPIDPAIR